MTDLSCEVSSGLPVRRRLPYGPAGGSGMMARIAAHTWQGSNSSAVTPPGRVAWRYRVALRRSCVREVSVPHRSPAREKACRVLSVRSQRRAKVGRVAPSCGLRPSAWHAWTASVSAIRYR